MKNIIIISTLCLISALYSFAQDSTTVKTESTASPETDTAGMFSDGADIPTDTNLTKQIRVVTEYEPSVSDAFKINHLPQANDTNTVKPNFKYSIESTPIETNFEVTPITAARMKGEPLTKLYKTFIRVGGGNYLTTHANLKMNSLRSSKHQYGIDLYHLGSFAKMKLDNGDKVPAATSTNYLDLYGKKFFSNANLYGDLNIKRNGLRYYGYNPNTFASGSGPSEDETEQRYFYTGLKGGIVSNKLDSASLHHQAEIKYQLTNEIEGNSENGINATLKLKKYFNEKGVGADVINDFYAKSGDASLSSDLLSFTPWVSTHSDQWHIKLGASLSALMGDYENVTVYPRIAFDFNIIDNMLIPYFLYTGYTEYNSMYKISHENQYMHNALNVAPTDYRNVFTGGMRGTITKDMPFNVYFKYSDVKDMYFYVNNFDPTATTTPQFENKFTVVYDDVSIINLHAESGFVQRERIMVLLSGDYYSYNMSNLAQAWHKPEIEVALKGKYNIQNKFIFNADFFFSGNRYAMSLSNPTNTYELKGYFDANLGVEYRYTKILSAFLNLNNIAAMKYQQWNFYPHHRFNAMLGITYAL